MCVHVCMCACVCVCVCVRARRQGLRETSVLIPVLNPDAEVQPEEGVRRPHHPGAPTVQVERVQPKGDDDDPHVVGRQERGVCGGQRQPVCVGGDEHVANADVGQAAQRQRKQPRLPVGEAVVDVATQNQRRRVVRDEAPDPLRLQSGRIGRIWGGRGPTEYIAFFPINDSIQCGIPTAPCLAGRQSARVARRRCHRCRLSAAAAQHGALNADLSNACPDDQVSL